MTRETGQQDTNLQEKVWDEVRECLDGCELKGESASLAKGMASMDEHLGTDAKKIQFPKTMQNDMVIILLVGGDKSSQEKGITKATELRAKLEE